jgi:nicotinamidase-related amidase
MTVTEAIIVADMLAEFVHGRLGNDRCRAIVPALEDLLTAARRSQRPVVYVCDAHLPSDPELRIWGPHAMKGTPEAQVIDELRPQSGDYVLEKRTYSAFYETGLDPLLRSLGIDSVVITGLYTHICDLHTSNDALARGYGITVVEDGVNAPTEEDHLGGLKHIREIFGARMTSRDRLIADWSRSTFTATAAG